jgi:hypothetical protein
MGPGSEQRKPLHRTTVDLALWKYSAAAPLPCSPIPTLAASLLPVEARARGKFRITSDTGIFNAPSDTPPPTGAVRKALAMHATRDSDAQRDRRDRRKRSEQRPQMVHF